MLARISGYPDVQTVCPSRAAFVQSWLGKSVSGCFPVKRGTASKIVRFLPSYCTDRGLTCTGVLALAQAPRWNGISALQYFQPDISTGTILHMEGNDSSPCLLHVTPKWQSSYINLGNDVYVSLKRYDPGNEDNTLYVKVLSGRHRGQLGWMAIQHTVPVVGQGLYGIVDPK